MSQTLRLILSTPTKSFSYTTDETSSIKIGRSLKCDFSVPLEDISREHCIFEIEHGNFFITDLSSSNGVWVNQQRISPNTKTEITPNCSVNLSNLYVLKINPPEIKTRSGYVIRKIDTEMETVNIQLNHPEERNKKKKTEKKQIDFDTFEEDDPSFLAENKKMIFGFFIIAITLIYFLFLKK